MQYTNLFDDYLHGRMSLIEEENFLQTFTSDPVLREEAISTAYLHKSLRDNKMR